MLRLIIIALLVWGGYYVVSSLTSKYQAIEKKEAVANQPAPAPVLSSSLEGMPAQLQGSLDNAESQGPAALKRWLDANRRYLRDPKLGDIELDLAVALMRQNVGEARSIYQDVKGRTPANSPLQGRLQRLSRSLE
jgi:hypothetical protein